MYLDFYDSNKSQAAPTTISPPKPRSFKKWLTFSLMYEIIFILAHISSA
jgi:hypothetical protein